MYIRKRKNKSGTISVQIIQKKHGKYKVLKHIGTAKTKTELDYLFSHAKDVKQQLNPQLSFDTIYQKSKQQELHQFLSRFHTPSFYKVGFFEIFGAIYDEFQISKAIPDPFYKDLVIARIAKPTSKLSTIKWLNTYHPHLQKSLAKNSIYRFLDSLTTDKQKALTNHIYGFVRDYLEDEINVLFFDATTIHFEAFKEDSLRKTGYSKVGKHNQPQIVVGLMVTREGLPVGYEVFPGNTFDGHTIRAALKKVSRNYNVKRVIFVADASMLSRDNVQLLVDEGFEFIMAASIKSMNTQIKTKVLDSHNYTDNIFEIKKYGEFKYRLIVSYSQKRAKKDKFERDKKVAKLRQKLQKQKRLTKSELGSLSPKKYMKIVGEATVSVDEDAVKKDRRWDGLKGYATNVEDLDCAEVIKKYQELWQVEKAFRVAKTDLNIRPVYHFKRKRIRAHILLVFTALTVTRFLTSKFKNQHIGIERIVENLDSVVEFPLVDAKLGVSVLVRPAISKFNRNLYETLGLPVKEGVYPQFKSML
ncbi:MAG: IS1634 family transposase [Patescibacteria group bacterium]